MASDAPETGHCAVMQASNYHFGKKFSTSAFRIRPGVLISHHTRHLWEKPMFRMIGALFSGLFVGLVARFFYLGSVPMGWWMTICWESGVRCWPIWWSIAVMWAPCPPCRIYRIGGRRDGFDLHRPPPWLALNSPARAPN
jgi:hypothetical protein